MGGNRCVAGERNPARIAISVGGTETIGDHPKGDGSGRTLYTHGHRNLNPRIAAPGNGGPISGRKGRPVNGDGSRRCGGRQQVLVITGEAQGLVGHLVIRGELADGRDGNHGGVRVRIAVPFLAVGVLNQVDRIIGGDVEGNAGGGLVPLALVQAGDHPVDLNAGPVGRGQDPEGVPVRPGVEGHGHETGAAPLRGPELLDKKVAGWGIERHVGTEVSADDGHGIIRSNEGARQVRVQQLVLKLVNLALPQRHSVRGIGEVGSQVNPGRDGDVGAVLGGHDRELAPQDRVAFIRFVVIRRNQITGPQSLHGKGQESARPLGDVIKTIQGYQVRGGHLNSDGLDPVGGGGFERGGEKDGGRAARGHGRGCVKTRARGLDGNGGSQRTGDE